MQAVCPLVWETPRCAFDPGVGAAQRWPTSALKIVESVDDGAGRQPGTADAVGKHRYVLILQLEGGSEVEQGCVTVSLKTNDLLLLDTRVPGRMRALTRSRQLRVYLRDPPVSQSAGRHPPPIGAISASCGLAVGLRCLILAMRGGVGRLTHREQWGLQAALFDLALAAVGADPARSGCGAPRQTPGLRRLALLQESVENRLSDPGLCPAHVAAEHGISTRQLHRLFKQTGTPFGAFVRRRRLERCRNDLADPQLRPLPMTEIAFRWGFSDSAHFSRCFRAAFGCTAREFRASRFRSDKIARAAEG